MMTSRTSLGVLTVMSPAGWFLACVLGVLACMLASETPGHKVPWMILGAMVIGSMLAVVPVVAALFAAYGAFQSSRPTAHVTPMDKLSWRWLAVAVLGAVEALVLPLSIITATADDDTLIVSIPFNLVIITAAGVFACWPHQKRAAIGICVVHMLGIVFATFAAAVDIESVMVSGLLLFATGLALSLAGTRPHAIRVAFALSTVVFILVSFLVIAIGGVSQSAAEAPLFAAIVAYQILFVPAGLLMLYRELSDRKLPFRAQFGLKQILGVMVVVCVASALTRLAHSNDDEVRVVVSLIVGLLVFTGVVTAIAAGWWKRWTDGQSQVSNASVV